MSSQKSWIVPVLVYRLLVAFLATSHKGLTSKGGEGGRAKIILQ